MASLGVKGSSMADESIQTGQAATALSTDCAKQAYERPVLTKLGGLRDMTLTLSMARGNRDGQRFRNTGRGGMNGVSQDFHS